MNESAFDQIQASARYLGIELFTEELAVYASEKNLSPETIEALIFNKRRMTES